MVIRISLLVYTFLRKVFLTNPDSYCTRCIKYRRITINTIQLGRSRTTLVQNTTDFDKLIIKMNKIQ